MELTEKGITKKQIMAEWKDVSKVHELNFYQTTYIGDWIEERLDLLETKLHRGWLKSLNSKRINKILEE